MRELPKYPDCLRLADSWHAEGDRDDPAETLALVLAALDEVYCCIEIFSCIPFPYVAENRWKVHISQ